MRELTHGLEVSHKLARIVLLRQGIEEWNTRPLGKGSHEIVSKPATYDGIEYSSKQRGHLPDLIRRSVRRLVWPDTDDMGALIVRSELERRPYEWQFMPMQERQTILEKVWALTTRAVCDFQVAAHLHEKPQLAWIQYLHRKDATAMEVDRHNVSQLS
jgi:hypothetical protein